MQLLFARPRSEDCSAIEHRSEHQRDTLEIAPAAESVGEPQPIELEAPESEPAFSLAQGETDLPGIADLLDRDVADERWNHALSSRPEIQGGELARLVMEHVRSLLTP